MNLFFSKLTGKLQSTGKLEQRMVQEEERIARYRQVEQSEELKEYLQLKQVVESKEFLQKKSNLTRTKYKTTKVYQTLKEFNQLRKNKSLQLYLEIVDSERLKEYLEFRASDNYVKLQSSKEVRNSLELKQMAAFEKSKEYKAYLEYKSSKLPERYKALEAEVATEAFHEEHAFWANPHRWLTTEEYRQEIRFKQLSKMQDIVFYLKEDKKAIEQMEQFHTTFTDDFDWVKLSDSQWRAGFAYKNKALKRIHSFANEQQAYTGGQNVGAVQGKLKLFTKREDFTAAAWDQKRGFIQKDYKYTSDIIQTAEHFKQREGLIMAKLRCEGKIHHAFWLGSGDRLPVVSIFHFNGKNITLGNYTTNGFEGEVLTGIAPKDYFIYSLRWTKNEMIWYINNLEVFRTKRNVPQEELYLAFSSFISDNQKATEGQLQVAWVKAYQID